MSWPATVPLPPPLQIHIPMFPSQLRTLPPILATQENMIPVEERNILTPFKLEKIEYFQGVPFYAHYEHVRIRIQL